MRLIKVFGLSIITAIAAMAFVGASSASAENTALCTIDAGICSAGELAKHVHYESTEAIIKTTTPSLTIKCKVSYLGDVLSPWLASPLVIHGNLKYSGCKPAGYEIKEISTSALFLLLKEGTELAKTTAVFQILVNCGEVLHCHFNADGLVFHSLGPLTTGDNGHITITEQTLNKVLGTLCPVQATLTVLFVALPTPLYISF